MSQSLLAQAMAGGGFLFPLKPGELKRKNPHVLGDPSRPGWLLPQAGDLLPCQKAAQVAGSVGTPHWSLLPGFRLCPAPVAVGNSVERLEK